MFNNTLFIVITDNDNRYTAARHPINRKFNTIRSDFNTDYIVNIYRNVVEQNQPIRWKWPCQKKKQNDTHTQTQFSIIILLNPIKITSVIQIAKQWAEQKNRNTVNSHQPPAVNGYLRIEKLRLRSPFLPSLLSVIRINCSVHVSKARIFFRWHM